ncbi:MAG: DUF5719 family protein, partial [Candidatus Nanopelagicales bacterium]|nr:DUF5719 family protein [Candidatus Nanopelagicales bacterium]
MSRRSGLAAVLVLALGVGVVAVGTFAGEDLVVASGDSVAPVREHVRSSRLGCPDVGDMEGRSTWVSAASVPGLPGQSQDGSLNVIGGAKLFTIGTPGGSGTVDQFSSDSAQVRATGGMAPGVVSARVSSDRREEGRGIASTPCSHPSSDLWLLGGGASKGQRDVLVLTNPTDTDAVADVRVYGPEGLVDTTGTRGLAVGPGQAFELQLDAVAPDVPVLALHVTTKVGLVTAAVLDNRMDGLIPRGVEIIPATAGPRKRIVIPGVPSGTGVRELLLFAPDKPGTVKVRAFTSGGVVGMPAMPGTRVGADSVVRVGLTGILAGRAAAVEVTSNVPVLAAVSASSDLSSRGSDLVWGVPGSALSGASAIAGLRSGWSTKLLLTATDGDVRASISVLPEALSGAKLLPVGDPGGEIVVPSGRTV